MNGIMEKMRTEGREDNATHYGGSIERKPRALIEAGEGECVFQSFTDYPFIPGLHEAAEIDIRKRHPDLLQRMKQIPHLTEKEFETRYADLIDRAKNSEIAERIVNGVKVGFTQRLELTGEKIQRLSEDPLHPDHGWPHVRRVKSEAHQKWLAYPKLQHNGFRESLMIALFSEYHDKGQLPALLWNKENPNESIKVKAGHAEEGGIIVELLQEEIQKCGAMTEAMAKEVAGLTSILIFVHDIPELRIKRLNGTVRANWMEGETLVSLPDDELFRHYAVDNDLNMFTTSPAQRLKILRFIKGEKKVLSKGGRNWGMHPEVEAAYKKELAAMEADPTPTFLDVPQDVLKGAIDAGTICLDADMKDMMASVKAHVRKFNVNASMERGIFKTDANTLDRILGNVGDDTQSDYERAMWEILEYVRLNKASKGWGDLASRNRTISIAINSLSATHKFYLELMRGEDGLYVIDESLVDRLWEIGTKSISKAKTPKEQLKRIKEYLGDLLDPEEMDSAIQLLLSQLSLPSAPKYFKRYKARAEAIIIESETAKRRIREKPNNDMGFAHTYNTSELDHAQYIYTQLIEYFAELIDMPVDEALGRLEVVRKMFSRDSFDSVGGIADIKTLVPLTAAQEKLLARLEDIEL